MKPNRFRIVEFWLYTCFAYTECLYSLPRNLELTALGPSVCISKLREFLIRTIIVCIQTCEIQVKQERWLDASQDLCQILNYILLSTGSETATVAYLMSRRITSSNINHNTSITGWAGSSLWNSIIGPWGICLKGNDRLSLTVNRLLL